MRRFSLYIHPTHRRTVRSNLGDETFDEPKIPLHRVTGESKKFTRRTFDQGKEWSSLPIDILARHILNSCIARLLASQVVN